MSSGSVGSEMSDSPYHFGNFGHVGEFTLTLLMKSEQKNAYLISFHNEIHRMPFILYYNKY